MKLKKYLSFLRINKWFHLLGVPFIGFLINSNLKFSPTLIKLLLISFFGLGFSYSWNSIFDKIKGGSFDQLTSYKNRIVLPIIFLFLAYFISILTSFISFLIVLFISLLVIVYETPPLRLKRYPYLGTLLNSVGFALFFFLGAAISGEILQVTVKFIPVVILLISVSQLFHESQDINEDQKKGIKTTVQGLGIKKTRFLIYLFLFFTVFGSFLIGNYIFYLTIMLSIAVFVEMKTKEITDMKKSFRYASIVYGVAILIILFFK